MPLPLRILGTLLLAALLAACNPPTALNFREGPPGTPLRPERLLTDQVIPADLMLSVPEALKRAPPGSVILACAQHMDITNFFGVCSHLARKLEGDLISDTPGMFKSGVQDRPISSLYWRYAVIVLDVGVKPEHLNALRAATQQWKGTPYMMTATQYGLDCATYQNLLQHTLGLPDVVNHDPNWNAWLPPSALNGPALRAGGKVLWVGVKGHP